MKKVFQEVGSLDKKCYESFGLTEDILMEHAASAMMRFCEEKFDKKTILIVSGMGNNGADGIALARLLYKRFDVKLYIPFGAQSNMAILQLERARKLGVVQVDFPCSCDVLVDCLFGSGLSRELSCDAREVITRMNYLEAYKLSCDIPSGVNQFGQIQSVAFKADTTITMGAYKESLFSDSAKDYIGELLVANLGVQASVYEDSTTTYLLEEKDMKLPFRINHNTHKGTFGHVSVIVGEKAGAGKLCCQSAFTFGAGLVTAIAHKDLGLPYHIMQSHCIPTNSTSIALGMGLGKFELSEIRQILKLDIPKVIDADLFYEEILLEGLNQSVVLTPHPKEFCSLLSLCKLANIEVDELQENRFKYVRLFMERYPQVTLLLKGANTLIVHNKILYINTLGRSILSKGGSGDVLTGLITSLLAQGYSTLDASITASLSHAVASNNVPKNSYALNPQDIIEQVSKL